MSSALSFGCQGHPPRPRAGGLVFLALFTCALTAAACSRGEAPPQPVATHAPAPPLTATSPRPASPQATGQPAHRGSASGDPSDFSDTADFEWDLADEAEDPDFEIDAACTSFYMPQGNTVTFKAKALNGTPPFTFTWNFADGSPEGSGEMVKHVFTKLGNLDVVVTGRDASGATSLVTLGILVATREDFLSRMGLDPEASPSPAVTP